MQALTGYLSIPQALTGTLTARTHISGTLTKIGGMTGSLSRVGEPYTGEYIVTPLVHSDQQLETKGRNMADNVTVKKVPYYEVANPKGGTTIIIGEN